MIANTQPQMKKQYIEQALHCAFEYQLIYTYVLRNICKYEGTDIRVHEFCTLTCKKQVEVDVGTRAYVLVYAFTNYRRKPY